jgi:uncharacterized protein YndB with AHSA1/START domain
MGLYKTFWGHRSVSEYYYPKNLFCNTERYLKVTSFPFRNFKGSSAMIDVEMIDAKVIHSSFEVSIRRSVPDVWRVLVEDINAWWAADFRIFGEGSVVSLDASAGGMLLETNEADGGSLEWFRVQMVSPPNALYLVGNLASDWGGPTISMLKLALEERDQGTLLSVSESFLGKTSESAAKQSIDGWGVLFGDSLKDHAEAQ